MVFYTKSLLSVILICLALVNFFTALELLGRTGQARFKTTALRLTHRWVGYAAVALLIVISWYCLTLVKAGGANLSCRATLHSALAVTALTTLGIKLTVVRFYKKLYSLAIPLGIVFLLLLFCLTALSAGHYFIVGRTPVLQGKVTSENAAMVKKGRELFASNGCSDCHYTDRTAKKIGPGLKGLFQADTMPASGKPVTEENVRRQLLNPSGVMPPFKKLSEDEIKTLVMFVKTL